MSTCPLEDSQDPKLRLLQLHDIALASSSLCQTKPAHTSSGHFHASQFHSLRQLSFIVFLSIQSLSTSSKTTLLSSCYMRMVYDATCMFFMNKLCIHVTLSAKTNIIIYSKWRKVGLFCAGLAHTQGHFFILTNRFSHTYIYNHIHFSISSTDHIYKIAYLLYSPQLTFWSSGHAWQKADVHDANFVYACIELVEKKIAKEFTSISFQNIYALAYFIRQVYIVGHIPPGSDERQVGSLPNGHTTFSEKNNLRYLRLVRKYSTIILGQFFGHLHSDSFRIIYNEIGKSVVLCVINIPIDFASYNYTSSFILNIKNNNTNKSLLKSINIVYTGIFPESYVTQFK